MKHIQQIITKRVFLRVNKHLKNRLGRQVEDPRQESRFRHEFSHYTRNNISHSACLKFIFQETFYKHFSTDNGTFLYVLTSVYFRCDSWIQNLQ
jgi:hypothetical protein